VLMKSGFSVSHQKVKVMGPNDRKILNNLTLGRSAGVQKTYLSRIRAGINNLRQGKVKPHDMDDYVQRLDGSINYLRLFDLGKADKFQDQLGAVLDQRRRQAIPLP
jgi:hypothetical protein